MKPTRLDVAKLAGVSEATVSYVLNNKGKTSEETRQRVLAAVASLNYKPDMIARSMATNETMQLGIVLENLANPFFGEIVRGFESAANDRGYFVNICTGYNKLDDYFENFITRRLDGVFIVAIPPKFHMDEVYRLVEHGVRVIMSGNVEADLKRVSSIESDYVGAMDAAVGHLYGLGHRRIAFVSGLSRSHGFDLRAAGYRKALGRHGLDTGDSLLFDGAPPYTTDVDDGFRLTCRLIESGREFTAVICLNDLMAIGAIKACRRYGLRVPEDVSVMGFDDIPYAEVWEPPLTTMAVRKQLFGAKAFDLLYANIRQGSTGYYSNALRLVARESTARARE